MVQYRYASPFFVGEGPDCPKEYACIHEQSLTEVSVCIDAATHAASLARDLGRYRPWPADTAITDRHRLRAANWRYAELLKNTDLS
jgi:hypothetical protein